jgi:hypothetical protein
MVMTKNQLLIMAWNLGWETGYHANCAVSDENTKYVLVAPVKPGHLTSLKALFTSGRFFAILKKLRLNPPHSVRTVRGKNGVRRVISIFSSIQTIHQNEAF